MDSPKITWEQFNEYKAKCRAILSELDETVEKNKDNPNFNKKEFEAQLIQRYLAIQSELLKFDLSTIPYTAWEDFLILTDKDYPVDLSNTHANIDFLIFDYDDGINFKGCKIKNLNSLNRMLKSSDFDQKVIDENKKMFLSDSFSQEFQQKLFDKKMTIPDLFSLNREQLTELRSKRSYYNHFEEMTRGLINLVGLDNLIQLYSISKDDFQKVYELFESIVDYFENIDAFEYRNIQKTFRNTSPSEIKQKFYSLEKQKILSEDDKIINPKKYPESFVRENDDIFMFNIDMPDDLRKRFYERKLTFDDVRANINIFKNIKLSKFIDRDNSSDISTGFRTVVEAFGDKTVVETLEIFPEHFNYIIKGNLWNNFSNFVTTLDKLELNQGEYDKKILMDFLQSFFASNNKITNTEQLMLYNHSLFPLAEKQNRVIQILGLENIKRFEKETGFFFQKESDGYIIPTRGLSLFEYCFNKKSNILNNLVDFKDGTLNYEMFVDEMAKCLDVMREKGIFRPDSYNNFPNYDWIQGEFRENHPEIFIDLNAPYELKNAFYKNVLKPKLLYNHKDYVKYLVDKNLSSMIDVNLKLAVPREEDGPEWWLPENCNFVDEYISRYGNEKFLQLCVKYGIYIDDIAEYLNKDIAIRHGKYVDSSKDDVDFEGISKKIESIIIREIKLCNIPYGLDNAPNFLKENCPELFLEDNAPEELKKYFYNYAYKNHDHRHYLMTFDTLQHHKEWLLFLKDKTLIPSLVNPSAKRKEMLQYLLLFGEEKGIKLGIKRGETVHKMISSSQVELMKKWYDKTGGKFIPDFVVMQNFKLEEADKFLISGSLWSKLMRIKNFAEIPESREAMLKLAYSFGVFDQDQRGFKKLQDLLTSLPKKIDADNGYIIDRVDRKIDQISQRDVFYHNKKVIDANGDKKIVSPNMTLEEKEEAYNKMLKYTKKSNFIDFIDAPTLVNLFETLKKEKVDIDFSKPIFAQFYRKNEDGIYSLIINSQSCPKSSQIIRGILGKFRGLPILTPEKADLLFGRFCLKYDVDFREFVLANMDNIMKKPEYVSFVSSIQKQFSEIKAVNSNRTLTLELAVSYVQSNKYAPVNVGNEQVAEISAIAGYTQKDFETLQQIYNYGKQRTFSSIPRIEAKVEKTSGRYTYEILRLDDPLAMAIGTLTKCCQELNKYGEVCMEHSMVDKNGRVFVIKNEEGNAIAQSWVWRNKNVLCFDNIEIPNKAFDKAVKEHPGFTNEIFQIYKQAAHDLIQADDVEYKKLLEGGKITQEQYEGLRLGKVTVGLGWNAIIAESIKQNSVADKKIARPLPFKEPVKLSRELYTSDSATQYILEQREDRKEYYGKTLPIHADSYIEYDDSSFKEKNLLSLEKLELITKPNATYLDTQLSEHYDKGHIVSQLAHNYELNPETTRIILHPNFAIIYDVNGDQLKIGDLLYNTVIDYNQQQMNIEDKVTIQLRLALEQIAQNKQIDISSLNDSQIAMYSKAVGLTEELDYERGVGRAR